MTDHLRLHRDDDEDVTRGLRSLFAAPADDAYWRALEARILARLHGDAVPSIAWWDELHSWARPALVAAALVLLAAGVAVARNREVTQQTAFAAVFTPTSLPVETAVRPVLEEPRDATLRYLITR